MTENENLKDPATRMPIETQAIAGNTIAMNEDYRAYAAQEPSTAAAMESQRDDRLEVGLPALTIDGKQLGKVGDLTAQHFKVHRSMLSDYWIDDAYISEVDESGVIVQFTRENLDSYKLDHPQTSDAMLSSDEQLEQRAAMEADLSRQNKELAGTQ